MYDLIGKKILITGACGTIGSALARQLLSDEYENQVEVIGLDNNESELFHLANEYKGNSRCRFTLGDIRDRDILLRETKGVDIVLHAAALKHVSICEQSPFEAVKTNLLGVQNVIDASLANNVEKVIFTSSDKAANPTSNMGASKLLGEGLITAANRIDPNARTVFSSTRFGNVLGSRGSVVPIFRKQISKGENITLTHRDMTRFIMGVSDAVRLVLDSTCLARGGEIYVTKMPIIRIRELAEVMIEQLAPLNDRSKESIRIVETGIKPGEKIYEELMTEHEAPRSIELEKYFVILPPQDRNSQDLSGNYPNIISHSGHQEYTSAAGPYLDKEALKDFLVSHDLLFAPGN